MKVATYARVDIRPHRLAATLERRQERLATYVASRAGWDHVASYSDSGPDGDRHGRLGHAGVRVHSLHTARRAALTGLVDLAFVDWLWEGPR